MSHKYLLLFLSTILFSISALAQKDMDESDYQAIIQQELGGRMEYPVTSGRVDLLTEKYAIEVEFANKWKQSIGQALWYGLETNRTSGIILIKRSPSDYKYVIQLSTTLAQVDLDRKIKVWVYPDDFPNAARHIPDSYDDKNRVPTSQEYWLTASSKRRHNSTCRYYKKTSGKHCSPSHGIACKRCGG